MRMKTRLQPRVAIFLLLSMIFGIFLISSFKLHTPLLRIVKEHYLNPYTSQYDEKSVPFTDFNNSMTKTHGDFWVAHTPSYQCPPNLLSRVGKENGDGGKWMCGLETLGRRTIEDDYNCTLYSFGVAGDSTFEAAVLQTAQCSIYGYDPTVNKIGVPLKMSNPRVHFEKLGISGNDTATKKTLKALMERNGHKFIDILKVDVEGAEYESLERMLADFDQLPFGQLLVELHNSKWDAKNVNRILDLLKSLETREARVFSVEPNVFCPNSCSEYSLINLNYLALFIPDLSISS